MSLTLRLALFVLCLVQSGAAYRPTIVTSFTIPKCDKENHVYSSALYTFVNSVRSNVANGNGGAIVDKTSDHVTKQRNMDGMSKLNISETKLKNYQSERLTRKGSQLKTYSCYYEGIARGLLGETLSEHQRRGLNVIHYQKNHGTSEGLQKLLQEAYNFWVNDTKTSLQWLIYPTASYMGCSLRDIKVEEQSDLYDFKVACVFVDHRPKHTPFLVDPSGTPCKEDTDYSTDRTCKHELCFAPVMDVVYQ